MKITIDLAYGNGGGDPLAARLGLPKRHIEVEALTAREVFEYLHAQSPTAKELMRLRFNRIGLNGGWIVIVNYEKPNCRYIKSDADLDIPLQEGDSIRITSAVAGG